MLEKILELQNAHGSKAKADILHKYKNDMVFRRFLYYALNPMLSYNLSVETLELKDGEKYDTASALHFFNGFFDCCEYLASLRGIDGATIRQVKALLYGHCDNDADRVLWIGLFSKTVRLGVTAKSVNKAIPGLIPEWEVQQAYPIEKYPISGGTEFWLTQKLNGNRATYYRGEMIARSGNPYTGLEHITNSIQDFCTNRSVVLDGEIILRDDVKAAKGFSDNEAFRYATGILNSDGDKSELFFVIFDIIPLRDFESATPRYTYAERRDMLDNAAEFLNTQNTAILAVLYRGIDQRVIPHLLQQMVAEDKEGLMLNTDVPYLRKRHRGILKVKRFYTMDLPIVGIEEGYGRLAGTLGSIIVEFRGNKVSVGSGFTDDQRSEYWARRESIIGALCEVKYKEVSYDKSTGLHSLQFPVFVRLRDDKHDVSYW